MMQLIERKRKKKTFFDGSDITVITVHIKCNVKKEKKKKKPNLKNKIKTDHIKCTWYKPRALEAKSVMVGNWVVELSTMTIGECMVTYEITISIYFTNWESVLEIAIGLPRVSGSIICGAICSFFLSFLLIIY